MEPNCRTSAPVTNAPVALVSKMPQKTSRGSPTMSHEQGQDWAVRSLWGSSYKGFDLTGADGRTLGFSFARVGLDLLSLS